MDTALKLKLIVWKCWKLRIRKWFRTLVEIAAPCLVFMILVLLKKHLRNFQPVYVSQTQYFPTTTVLNKLHFIHFCPKNSQTNKIMEIVKSLIGHGDSVMQNFIDKDACNLFDDSTVKKLILELRLILKFLKKINVYKTPIVLFDQVYTEISYIENQYYFTSNFLTVQQAVDTAFIKLHKELDFDISFQQMPFPPHWITVDTFNQFKSFFPLLIMSGFLMTAYILALNICAEKASGMQDLMKMMGLETWMLWLGWYIFAMMTLIVAIIISTILMKVHLAKEGVTAVIAHGNAFIFIMFLFLYCTSMVFFCFFISTLGKSPMVVTGVIMAIWMLSMCLVQWLEQSGTTIKFLRVLILIAPNSCLYYGFQTLMEFELIETGIQFSNIFAKPSEIRFFHSMGTILIFLTMDSLVFLGLTFFIDGKYLEKYGRHLGEKKPVPLENYVDSNDAVEDPNPDLQPGIQIRKLQKYFGSHTAVNGLNLDVYANQITVLLGHNGAGKTTTMNIVTGLIPATSGQVFIDGHCVQTELNKVRNSFGMCPQQNVFIPNLTVIEHLILFAMLKGMSYKEAENKSTKYLKVLGISSKAHEKAENLSGGMKRRLCLGLAVVGNTKVLILDEPTSGMDPESRREVWDILLKMRGSRTILITTHFMEEADILGDRIAIMHNGQLMCYGTPLFLKKYYGTGYVLTVLFSRNIDIHRLEKFIKKYINNVQLKNASGDSAKFTLPTNNTATLTELFVELENSKKGLGVISYGVSITSMDDVFLKVGKLAEKPDEQSTTSDSLAEIQCKYNSGVSLIQQQLQALFVKRYIYTKSNYKSFFYALLVAMLYVSLAILSISSDDPDNSRVYNLGAYSKACSYYSYDKSNEKLASFYEKTVRDQQAVPTSTNQVSAAILRVAEEDLEQYYSTLITAAELNSTGGKMNLNAMYGRVPLHSPVISLNLITNALLKFAMDNEESYITVENNPLEGQDIVSDVLCNSIGTVWLMLAFGEIIPHIISCVVEERTSGVKHLQIMSGVSRTLYWLCNYFIDLIVFILFILIIIIIFLSPLNKFTDYLCTYESMKNFVVLLLEFGAAIFPCAYFFHYVSANAAQGFILLCFLVFGSFLPMIFFLWEVFLDNYQKELREILTYILMLTSPFAAYYGLVRWLNATMEIGAWNSMTTAQKLNRCGQLPIHSCCQPNSKKCQEFFLYYEGKQSLKMSVIFLAFDSVIYFMIFLFVDYGYLRKYKEILWNKLRNLKPKIIDESNIDSDVLLEQKKISAKMRGSIYEASSSDVKETNPAVGDVLLVSDLRKWFGKFHAVDGISFSVKEKECFGLLGVNGAGKSTTFKMLTAEIFPSTGTANIFKYSLSKNKTIYLTQIGYCPQFDAFNDQLTARAMLTTFANLKGIHESYVDMHVNYWLNIFDIMQFKNVKVDKLSGGNKRKLSTAIALIGEPPLVMLDEPTSGVDPVARRNLWTILSGIRNRGKAIVLTSHSMDECEALCDRLAIMVDGEMKCIGNMQYLKSKFGRGFTIMVKLRHIITVFESFEVQVRNLKTEIENKYTCTLKDEHTGMVMYHVTETKVSLGEIFQFMEHIKYTRTIVEDYTISDPNLEQLFMTFAEEKKRKKN